METTTENHSRTEGREQGFVGVQLLWMNLCHSPCIYSSGNNREEGWKDCKSRNTRKPAVNVSPRNGCKNKTGTIATSKDVYCGREIAKGLLWKGNCQGSHPQAKNYRHLMTAGRRISLSRGRGQPLIVCAVQGNQPGNCIHTTSKDRLSRLYSHIVVQTHTYRQTCIHTYINLHITTIKKKDLST